MNRNTESRSKKPQLIDPKALFIEDNAHGNDRFVAVGMSERARVLFVVHVERSRRDRIISARLATKEEEALYAEEH